MDKNKEYSEIDDENDGFMGQSSYDDLNGEDNRDEDYGYDGSDTDYEDLEDKWYEIEEDYRNRYPDITDDDVKVEPGRFDSSMDRIGRRSGKSPGEVRVEIENW